MTAPLVYIVDDDEAVRGGLSALLESADLQVRAFGDAAGFMSAWTPGRPSCLLLDVRMPELNGLDLQQRLVAQGVDLPIIFMSGHGTIPITVQAIKAGAQEFLTKPIDETLLLNAVDAALGQARQSLAQALELQGLRARLETLTPREREVLRLTISGKMIKQMAGALGTSEITAKVHKRRVMDKMGARTLVDLVHIAEKLGVPPTSPAP